MIAPLRRRHRALFVVLALALPVGVVAALRARPDFPIDANVRPAAPHVLGRGTTAAVTALGVELHLALDRDSLLIEALDDPKVPDLLIYWSAQAPAPGALPADARLLGELPGTRLSAFPCPPESRPPGASTLTGSLYFYDLGHATLLGALALTDLALADLAAADLAPADTLPATPADAGGD